ncbi:hypothetical protein D3C87_2047710 [compost metagenome]
MTANNQLQGIQYPVYEFDEIDTESETNRILVEVSEKDVKNACENSVRSFSERNTSL